MSAAASLTPSAKYYAQAYGCLWRSDLPLPLYRQVDVPASEPEIDIVHVRVEAPERKVTKRSDVAYRASDGLRYRDDNGLVMDAFRGDRVILYTAPDWAGLLPQFLFGTMAADLMAWRGLVPLHGSAVEWNGKGVVLCGPSGAGKSSLAAALLMRGAKLLSDDLTVLDVSDPLQPPVLFAGRKSLRLYPSTADSVAQAISASVSPSHEGKLAVSPPTVDAFTPVPLHDLILLGEAHRPAGAAELLRTLQRHMFRPRTMPTVPGHSLRLARLSFAAQHIRAHALPILPLWSPADLERAADAALSCLARASE